MPVKYRLQVFHPAVIAKLSPFGPMILPAMAISLPVLPLGTPLAEVATSMRRGAISWRDDPLEHVDTRKLRQRERLFPSRSNGTRGGGPQEAEERGAFHVARRTAGSGVPQAVAHGA